VTTCLFVITKPSGEIITPLPLLLFFDGVTFLFGKILLILASASKSPFINNVF
jgi:hypothetical protein